MCIHAYADDLVLSHSMHSMHISSSTLSSCSGCEYIHRKLNGSKLSTYVYHLSEWKFPLRGRITYRHCRQPKLPNPPYSSNTTSWRLMRRANNNNLVLSEWKFPLRDRIAYRHCRQPKLPNLSYSSSTTSWRLMRRANNNDLVLVCAGQGKEAVAHKLL